MSYDDELLNDFVAESREHLDTIEPDLREMAADLQRLVGQFQVGTARFDIAEAKTAHLALRMQLEMALEGHEQLDAARVTDAQQCEFGKWLDSPLGRTLSSDPAFDVVRRVHDAVHVIAAQTAGLVEQGNTEEARKQLAAFEGERLALFTALDDLYGASQLSDTAASIQTSKQDVGAGQG